MPVDATPIWERTAYELQTCNDLDILIPEISEAFDEQLLAKKRACKAREGTTVYLRMIMRDRAGVGADLQRYGIQGSVGLEALDSSSSSSSATTPSYGHVKVRFREAALVVSTTYEMDAAVLSAGDGIIMCAVPSQVMQQKGIWFAEAGAFNADGDLLFTDEIYIYMEHSAWTTTGSGTINGPPLIDDIRLAMRDNSPYENELLEDYDFGVVEICHAAIRTINFWNEQPPIITNARYSTFTMPFREIWTAGIKLFLFQMAEEHYRRNHFKHSAGGTMTDDKNRHREYNSAWKEQFQQFRRMVMHQKATINARNAYSGFGWR